MIIGGVHAGAFGRVVADWVAASACRRGGLDVDVLDLAEVWLPDAPPEGSPRPPVVEELGRWLAAADAFVIVTPERNHSFPASLKNAIDWYAREWRAKPVAFASYGGPAGGLRAVEQLRQVFAALEAVTVRDAVSLAGEGDHPAGHAAAADRMLDRLLWWAEALRGDRAGHPASHRAEPTAPEPTAPGTETPKPTTPKGP